MVLLKIYFKNNWCNQSLSDFTTIKDEALAILIYENNAETWKDMVDKNITKNSKVTKKYTNGGTPKGTLQVPTNIRDGLVLEWEDS